MKDVNDLKEIISKISKDTGVEIPNGYKYRYAPYQCWKCHKDILIFIWSDRSLLGGDSDIPPEPRPRSLQLRSTQMSGESYWANTCTYCDSVQGDFFIKAEPDSPFFSTVDAVIDTKGSFDTDMDKIANYYFTELYQ